LSKKPKKPKKPLFKGNPDLTNPHLLRVKRSSKNTMDLRVPEQAFTQNLGSERKAISFVLPMSILYMVDALAEANGHTRSRTLLLVLEFYFAKILPAAQLTDRPLIADALNYLPSMAKRAYGADTQANFLVKLNREYPLALMKGDPELEAEYESIKKSMLAPENLRTREFCTFHAPRISKTKEELEREQEYRDKNTRALRKYNGKKGQFKPKTENEMDIYS